MSEKVRFTAKEMTLKMLEECRGTPISGEKLAAEIGVSRAAIWKAVKSLINEGYSISAATNKGYILSCDSDVLSAQGMIPFLDPEKYPDMEKKIFTYKCLESTNKTAKQMAFEGAADRTIVLAEEQTQGRGRLGRSFYSPQSTGLYMSLIIRPDFDMNKALLVTTAAAVAVCRAIKSICGIEAQIKWVNDIYISGKKVGGILTEAVTSFENGAIDSIIVGIGINCSTKKKDFPAEIRETVGSLFGRVSRNQLAAEIISQFCDILDHVGEGAYPKYMDEYRQRSMVLRKDVRVYKNASAELGHEFVEAKAMDISDEGGLIVIYANGIKETLTAGEISLRLI